MIVDRLSKMHHYIPCLAENEGTSAEETARLLIDHVWKLHGLPTTIVSDRGPQFVSQVWDTWCRSLKIKAKLSTAFHPETDGQSEIANQEMERYLRSYCNYQQDDWVKWLPMAEFASNATVSTSTGLSPFMANYGFEPRMNFDKVDVSEGSSRVRLQKIAGQDIAEKMREVVEFAKKNLEKAQISQKKHADKKRAEAPTYKVGQKVWLSTRNIRTTRPSKKLDHQMIGPYVIKKVVKGACQLNLPDGMKLHDTFHTSLLRPYSDDPLPGQIQPPPPPIEIEQDDPDYELDDILDSKRMRKKLFYKVQWTGYPPDPKWYPAENFENAPEIVADYHRRYST